MNKICANLVAKLNRTRIENSSYTTVAVLCRNLSFKSDLSLEKLYPNSRLQIYTPQSPNAENRFSGFIPINQLEITYRDGFGQHVNCVNTQVDIRFKLAEAKWIPEKTKQKLLISLQNKITKDGYFEMKSDLTRSQQMNLADILEKLRNLIREHEIEAKPTNEETIEKLRKRQERRARERLIMKH